ncbi:tRNA lysidine(34) synthetase TilS [Shewanella litorisediminis]|uniref:tRNA(Ile)-lysidine synthase n=1 Tax=Shewanella litorisediminis TaxID=1173586 RepID=A0ABX7G6A2_9GAMM|nr:tRNA lysidine(34) synthetase TilS [Shewanella litorisediminis]MCL2916942.1 tRNA lysidine(34) synthetase TilS [Shewanella litorisediminis]QRH02897.1 tRNA lysidine(34) synthetase TilS [Shewanella litorisediminis]
MQSSSVALAKLDSLVSLIEAALAALSPSKLVLGYSGGLDSELLACALSHYAKTHPGTHCLLVHVHHGLSPNADVWARHCESSAAHYGLDFVQEKVRVKRGARLSLEAEARSARYAALMAHLGEGDVLLTAHHQDDQLETVLLALTRGLGPKGLAAMGQQQPLEGGAFQVRPFLGLSRESLEEAVSVLGLNHIEDESNQDTRFDRNFLRADIIPRLKSRWGAIGATVSRSAELCAQTQMLLDEEVSERLTPLISHCPLSGVYRLALEPVAACSTAWQAQLVRGFLEAASLAPPSKVQLEEALDQLFAAKADAAVSLRFGNTRLRRFQGWLYAETESDNASHSPSSATQIPATQIPATQIPATQTPATQTPATQMSATQIPVTQQSLVEGIATPLGKLQLLPTGAEDEGLDGCCWQARVPQGALTGDLTLVYGLPGSTKAWPMGRGKRRELKKLWQEFDVPPWLRTSIPMLCCDQSLVAAVGVWIENSALGTPPEGRESWMTIRLSRD